MADSDCAPTDTGHVLHREVLRPGQKWSRTLGRGLGLRLTATREGASVAALFYNADEPTERYNMPDTLKGQFTARLSLGDALHSDMGRVLCSIVADSCGWHDTFTGMLDATRAREKYGDASYQQLRNDAVRNARDNVLMELAKHGLGARDLMANVNFFVKVTVSDDGTLRFVPGNSRPGSSVALRMDMNVLVVLSNTPHPLDPSPTYAPPPVELEIFTTDPRRADDLTLNKRPENARAFALTDLYFLARCP